jgi:hypothetical protein
MLQGQTESRQFMRPETDLPDLVVELLVQKFPGHDFSELLLSSDQDFCDFLADHFQPCPDSRDIPNSESTESESVD